ncbi:MAG: DCL family protein [Blastocatellia bacterium]|nr:DCL family protein [Blastocatellia bacterium]
MKNQIEIGNRLFKSKKEALLHFKNILNSYNFGELLGIEDFEDVYELLQKHPRAKEKIRVGIKEFRVCKIQHNTKCFEFTRTDSTKGFFGYIKCINGDRKAITDFSRACRRTIQVDLRNVKIEYFKKHSKKGRVKCQETGELLLYEELNVDHRQPNTFSVNY